MIVPGLLSHDDVLSAVCQADTDREFCTEKLGLKTFPTIIYLPKGREGFIKYPSEKRDVDTLKMWVKTFAGKL